MHRISSVPTTDKVKGYTHEMYMASGKILAERYLISGMGHNAGGSGTGRDAMRRGGALRVGQEHLLEPIHRKILGPDRVTP